MPKSYRVNPQDIWETITTSKGLIVSRLKYDHSIVVHANNWFDLVYKQAKAFHS